LIVESIDKESSAEKSAEAILRAGGDHIIVCLNKGLSQNIQIRLADVADVSHKLHVGLDLEGTGILLSVRNLGDLEVSSPVLCGTVIFLVLHSLLLIILAFRISDDLVWVGKDLFEQIGKVFWWLRKARREVNSCSIQRGEIRFAKPVCPCRQGRVMRAALRSCSCLVQEARGSWSCLF